MPTLAVALYALYLAVAFGWRTWLQVKNTGSTGFRGISGTPRTAEWWGGVLFVLALICGVAAPILQTTDTLNPIGALNTGVVQALGAVIAVLGIAMTVRAQIDMGVSWRIGVDQDEQTALVTRGLFAQVRNPIFTAMTLAALGLALLTPNAAAALGLIGLIVAIEVQVRCAEEPYLRTQHPDAFTSYAAQVGRFVPRLGRLRPAGRTPVAAD
ncbi:MAG: isoprenylcysteine carboxylmethyltransferase family protein [Solirubrobacteraceae bacterium]|nr:isoprenylcysteine carboxylmethyltransferase family protein [Solirubrobacteraceae bacterium]